MTGPSDPDHAGGEAGEGRPKVEEALDAVVRVAEVAAIAEDLIGARLARIGISFSDLRVLLLLERHGDRGLGRIELARARRLPLSQAVREIRPLEKLGWVLRTSDGNFGLT